MWSLKKRNWWWKKTRLLIKVDWFFQFITKTIYICKTFFRLISLLLSRRRRKSPQRPMLSLHKIQQSLLLLSTLLAAFHRSEKTVWLPACSISSRDYSSSAAISSDSLTVSPQWNSPLTGLSSSLEAEIRPFICGLSHPMSIMKKLRPWQFIRWRPNTNLLLATWPFHPIAVASSAVAGTRSYSFTALSRKNWYCISFKYLLMSLIGNICILTGSSAAH